MQLVLKLFSKNNFCLSTVRFCEDSLMTTKGRQSPNKWISKRIITLSLAGTSLLVATVTQSPRQKDRGQPVSLSSET
jgi:hypothetical protein